MEGMRALQDRTDTLIVIPNQNLFKMIDQRCVRFTLYLCTISTFFLLSFLLFFPLLVSSLSLSLSLSLSHLLFFFFFFFKYQIKHDSTTVMNAFGLADDVLLAGVKSITDLMVRPGLINLDFADVQAVMQGMGNAIMGTGRRLCVIHNSRSSLSPTLVLIYPRPTYISPSCLKYKKILKDKRKAKIAPSEPLLTRSRIPC